jgi:hypothetical protein
VFGIAIDWNLGGADIVYRVKVAVDLALWKIIRHERGVCSHTEGEMIGLLSKDDQLSFLCNYMV